MCIRECSLKSSTVILHGVLESRFTCYYSTSWSCSLSLELPHAVRNHKKSLDRRESKNMNRIPDVTDDIVTTLYTPDELRRWRTILAFQLLWSPPTNSFCVLEYCALESCNMLEQVFKLQYGWRKCSQGEQLCWMIWTPLNGSSRSSSYCVWLPSIPFACVKFCLIKFYLW